MQCGHGLQAVAALRYVRWNILLADPSFGMETAGRLFAFGVGDQPDIVGTHTHGKPFLHLAELVGAEPGLRRQSYQDGGIVHDGRGVGHRRRGQCHAHLPHGGEQSLHLLRHGRSHVLIARVLIELLLRGSRLGGLGAEHCLVVVAGGAYVAELAVEHHHGVGL